MFNFTQIAAMVSKPFTHDVLELTVGGQAVSSARNPAKTIEYVIWVHPTRRFRVTRDPLTRRFQVSRTA